MVDNKKIPKYSNPETLSDRQLMTKKEIKSRFDEEMASVYSQRRPLWLPDYDHMMRLLVKTLHQHCIAKSHFIDLGAGTGNTSLRVLENFPDCKVTLVDFSENMLKEVDTILSAFKGRYSIQIDDFFEVEFQFNNYDGVYSGYAIHHARGVAAYKELYKKIYSWLKSSGIFLCCDVVDGDSHIFRVINENGWSDFLKEQGFTQQDIEKIFSQYHREDSPISLKQHINSLLQAGFKNIEILWKRCNFALYAAVK